MADESQSESTGKRDYYLVFSQLLSKNLISRWLINVNLSLQINVMISWQSVKFHLSTIYFPTIELEEKCI